MTRAALSWSRGLDLRVRELTLAPGRLNLVPGGRPPLPLISARRPAAPSMTTGRALPAWGCAVTDVTSGPKVGRDAACRWTELRSCAEGCGLLPVGLQDESDLRREGDGGHSRGMGLVAEQEVRTGCASKGRTVSVRDMSPVQHVPLDSDNAMAHLSRVLEQALVSGHVAVRRGTLDQPRLLAGGHAPGRR